MSDLKPCPFCGDPMRVECRHKSEVGEVWCLSHVDNWKCWINHDKSFGSETEAIDAWNERTDLSARIIARADTVLALPVSDTFADGFREAWREARLMARGE